MMHLCFSGLTFVTFQPRCEAGIQVGIQRPRQGRAPTSRRPTERPIFNSQFLIENPRSRNELVSTETELRAMAPAASMGESSTPNIG